MERIIRNAVRCKKCGDIIESKNVHDIIACKCGCCHVDGGKQYIRRGYTNSPEEDYEELSEVECDNEKQKIPNTIR